MATFAVGRATVPAQVNQEWRQSRAEAIAESSGQFSHSARNLACARKERSMATGLGAPLMCHAHGGEVRCCRARAVTVAGVKGLSSGGIESLERGKQWGQTSRDGSVRFSQTPRGYRLRSPMLAIRAMDASIGGEGQEDYGPPPPFPRLGVRDPYKLLGVGRDASDEEVREAHNYLSNQYWGHEKSREAIEAAYDKIIMESFRDRKNSKINLKSSLKKKVSEAPAPIRALTNMIEVPPTQTIGQRAALFLLLGVWSVMNPADGGPAFQVAVSLAACIYFLNDRLKSLGRAFLLGFGALVVGWVSGSFLVPVLSSYILPPSWSLELSTALFSYIFLWAACTFLK